MPIILSEAAIQLTWDLAYVGIENNWMSGEDLLNNLDISQLREFSVEEIGEFYSAAQGPVDTMLAYLSRFTSEDKDIPTRVWAFAFLRAIVQSETSTREKLEEVAGVWAVFHYVASWTAFIYFMPVQEGQHVGDEHLYERLRQFLRSEAQALGLS